MPSAAITAAARAEVPSAKTRRAASPMSSTPVTRLPVLSSMSQLRRAAVEQARQQVGPVADAVGRAEALLEGLAQPDALEEGAGQPVPHVDFGGDDAGRLDRLPGAQRPQRAHAVGRHLEARPHLLEGRGLLEQAHGAALPGQPQGCRQPADAAAGDEEGKIVHGTVFSPFRRRG